MSALGCGDDFQEVLIWRGARRDADALIEARRLEAEDEKRQQALNAELAAAAAVGAGTGPGAAATQASLARDPPPALHPPHLDLKALKTPVKPRTPHGCHLP